jgi:hypothetical protein
MNLDKVKITAGEFVGVPDIKFNDVFGPVSGCDMDDEKLGAVVYNRGTEPIHEFTLTYQVESCSIVSQTFNETIGIKESVTVYFDQTADFSAIGEYNIHFTASTPNEENTDNNETDALVKHFEPITDIPYVSDFRIDWNPETVGAWEWSWANCYYPNVWDFPMGIPLLSRCITLQPGIYSFSFTYTAGWYDLTDDFYVAYGLSGTDPYEWEPAKELFNSHTGNGIIFDEEFVIFEITQAGEYVFAFFPVRVGDLAFFGVTVEAVVGISQERVSSNQLVLYPNPTDGELHISNEACSIGDMTGRNVYQITKLTNQQITNEIVIDVSHLTSGLYFISVQTKDGVVNAKFVKK